MCGRCRKPIRVPETENNQSGKKILSIALALLITGCASPKKTGDSASDPAKATTSAEGSSAAASADANGASKSTSKTLTTGKGATSCSIKGDERTIEIKENSPGCEVVYTKFGETKSIASAQNDMGYCQSVKDRIVGNLAKSGFDCK